MSNGGEQEKVKVNAIESLHGLASQKYDNLGDIKNFRTILKDPKKRTAFYNFASKDFDLKDVKTFNTAIDGAELNLFTVEEDLKKKELFERAKGTTSTILQRAGVPVQGTTADLTASTSGLETGALVSSSPIEQSAERLGIFEGQAEPPTFNPDASVQDVTSTLVPDPSAITIDQQEVLNNLTNEIFFKELELKEAKVSAAEEIDPSAVTQQQLLDPNLELPEFFAIERAVTDPSGAGGVALMMINEQKLGIVGKREAALQAAIEKRAKFEKFGVTSNQIISDATSQGSTVPQYIDAQKSIIVDELTQTLGLTEGGEEDDPLALVGKEYKILQEMSGLLSGEVPFFAPLKEGPTGRQEYITGKLTELQTQLDKVKGQRFDVLDKEIKNLEAQLKGGVVTEKVSPDLSSFFFGQGIDMSKIVEALPEGLKRKAVEAELDHLKKLREQVFETDPEVLAKNAAASMASSGDAITILQMLPPDLTPKESFDTWYYSLYQINRDLGKRIGGGSAAASTPGAEGVDVSETLKKGQIPLHMAARDLLSWELLDEMVGRGSFSLTGGEKRWIANEKILQENASIFFNNNFNIGSSEQGFNESFWNSFAQWARPETGKLTNPFEVEIAGNVAAQLMDMGFPEGDIKKGAIDALVARTETTPLLGEGFYLLDTDTWKDFDFNTEEGGKMAGYVGGAMVFYTIGALTTKGIGKGITSGAKAFGGTSLGARTLKAMRALDRSGKIEKAARAFYGYASKSKGFTRFITRPVQEGIKFEITGELFPNHEDEFNFMSGFMGSFVGGAAEGTINLAVNNKLTHKAVETLGKIFGKDAGKVVEVMKKFGQSKGLTVVSRGVGEVGEEFAQEITQIYRETGWGEEMFDEIHNRFGEMSDRQDFIISTFILGMGFGMHFNSEATRSAYDSLSDEERAQVDAVNQEFIADMAGANAAAQRVIAEDPEAAEALGLFDEGDAPQGQITTSIRNRLAREGITADPDGNVTAVNNIEIRVSNTEQTERTSGAGNTEESTPETSYKINDGFYNEEDVIAVLGQSDIAERIKAGELNFVVENPSEAVLDAMVENGVIEDSQAEILNTGINEFQEQQQSEAQAETTPEAVLEGTETPQREQQVQGAPETTTDAPAETTADADIEAAAAEGTTLPEAAEEVEAIGEAFEAIGEGATEAGARRRDDQISEDGFVEFNNETTGGQAATETFRNDNPEGFTETTETVDGVEVTRFTANTETIDAVNERIAARDVEQVAETTEETTETAETTTQPQGEQNLRAALGEIGESTAAPLANQGVFDSVAELAIDVVAEGELSGQELIEEVASRAEEISEGAITAEDISDISAEIAEAVAAQQTSEADTVEEVPSDKFKQAAAFVRSKTMGDAFRNMGLLQSNPLGGLFVTAIDGALETAATIIETTGVVADAVAAGVKFLKGTDWYKGLKDAKSRRQAESMFEEAYRAQVNENIPFLPDVSEPTVEPAAQREQALEGAPEVVTEPVVESEVTAEPELPATDELAAETEEPVSEESVRRAVIERIENDEGVSQEIKDGIDQDGAEYVPVTNRVTTAEAQAILDARGLDSSAELVSDLGNELAPATRVVLAKVVIQALSNLGGTANVERAVKVADTISKWATELGQGIQAFSMWDNISMEGMVISYNRNVAQARRSFRQKRSRLYTGSQEGYQTGTRRAARRAATRAVNPRRRAKAKRNGLTKEQIKAKIAAAKQKLKDSFKGGTATTGGLSTETIEALGELGYYTFLNGVRNIQDWVKAMKAETDLDEATLESVWRSPNPVTNTSLENMAELDNIEQVVEDHFASTDSEAKLSDTLMSAFGLTEDVAQELSNAIQTEFDRISNTERRKAMRSASGTRESVRSKAVIDEIAGLNNLTNQEIAELIDAKYGFSVLSEGAIEEMRTLDQQRESRPEGSLRNEKTLEMLKLLQREAGSIRGIDLMWSIWYANILSGHETQILNAAANILNLNLEFVVSAIEQGVVRQDPRAIAGSVVGFFEALRRSADEFMQTLTTGVAPTKVKSKVEVANVLENYKFTGVFKPLNAYKFVGRLMTAIDTAAFIAGKGMRKHETARRVARDEGLRGKALRNRVAELLNNSTEMVEQAQIQATAEIDAIEENEGKFSSGERKRKIRVRAAEIVEESIPEEIVADAEDFAAFVTFNYVPVGVMGAIAKAINALNAKIGISRLIVPFTGVVANVLNQQLDYTPYGYLRASGLNLSSFIPIDSTGSEKGQQRARALIKATMGTMLMTGLYMLAKSYEDDDDPWFAISGAGPSDFNKRNQLFSQGWKPYTIKVGDTRWNYQFTPLGVGLSLIGNWRDNEEFKELGNADFATKFGFAMANTGTSITDMSFLTGISGLMSALTSTSNPEKKADKFFKSVVRTAGGFVPFLGANFFKQQEKVFYDNTIYDTKTVQATILSQIPFASKALGLKPKIDAFGHPIEKQGNRFFTDVTDDPVWLFMAEKKLFAPGASPDVTMPDGVHMTEDEFYEYIQISGNAVYDIIKNNLENFQDIPKAQLKKLISKFFRDQRKIAKLKIQGVRFDKKK